MTQTHDASTSATVVDVTDEARNVVRDALRQEANAEELALWIDVTGVVGGKYTYDLYFQAVGDAPDDASTYLLDDIHVVIPGKAVERLQGARLEWSTDDGGGLVMVNPNAPSPAEVAPGVPEAVLAAGLEGEMAKKVVEVLEADVNPSIAGHGGRADLVALDEGEGIAYLALSGGCQGCAMSRMTLSQGIEVALKDQVPGLVEVVDVTDHAVGQNPFYAN
jgi:Fe/S biogenesis protein NfuA